jgi:protein phosphatase 2C
MFIVASVLTRDHRADSPVEAERIVSLGGTITEAAGPDDKARVEGIIEVTRSFGNYQLKNYVRCEPDVSVYELLPEDELLVLATDGIFDVISPESAVRVLPHIWQLLFWLFS